MTAITKKAKSLGLNIQSKGTGLIHNGVYYPHKKLDQLPAELSLANSKTRVSDLFVAFHSSKALLSNMYPACVQWNGRSFQSVEQGFQYLKSEAANAPEVGKLILGTADPYGVRRLAKPLRTPAWDAETILFQLMLCKFTQNEELKQVLLDTQGKRLLETTLDPYWGTGCDLYSKNIDELNFKGTNTMGMLLERVRSDIIT